MSSSKQVPEGFSVTVIALDDRSPLPAYVDTALRVNERYAAQFGICFRLVTRSGHLETMPPCWAHVALVADAHRRASAEPGARGFIIGLDSDAAFASLSFDLRQELVEVPADKVVVATREAPFRESGATLSSAFFAVRLGAAGGAFLDEWLGAYDAKRWRKVEGGEGWRPIDAGEAWAGEAYEQGQLNCLAGRHRGLFHEAPQWLLNSGFPRPASDAGRLLLPGVLHCTPWPGEGSEAREARARAAFQELLDSSALSDVSAKGIRELGDDELARTTRLLGRPPRNPAPALAPSSAQASVLAPAEEVLNLASAMRLAQKASEVVPSAASSLHGGGAPFEVLD